MKSFVGELPVLLHDGPRYGSRVASRLFHRQLWFDTCQDLKIVVPAAARRRTLGGESERRPELIFGRSPA
jgi:hypothetical protein